MSDCKTTKGTSIARLWIEKIERRRWTRRSEPIPAKHWGCIYIVLGTRLDIAYVNMLWPQYTSQRNTKHMRAATAVLGYLQGSWDQKLLYTPSQDDVTALELVGYTDFNCANDKDDRKSISDYIFYLNGNTISWRAKKRGTVATFITEAKLYTMSFAAKHLSWIKEGLPELGYGAEKATLNGDNQSTLTIIKREEINDITKHVAVTYHHIRNLVLKQNRFPL